MTVYVRKTKMPTESDVNKYTAAIGFYLRGEEIVRYDDPMEIKEIHEADIIVDYVMETQILLEKMGITVPEFDYPEILRPYFGRNLRQGTMGEIVDHPEAWGVFVKPMRTEKSFTGRVISSARDLIGIGVAPQFPIWISDAVDFVAEWRSFIVEGEVVDVRPYLGDYHVQFDASVLDKAVAAWNDAPGAYSLDIGVTAKGETLIVEINDGYALGCYGLNPYKYAIFLQTRWQELTQPYFAKHDVFKLQ